MIKGTANLDIVLDLPGTSSVVRKHILNKSTSKYKIINRAKSHVTTGKTVALTIWRCSHKSHKLASHKSAST